MYEPLFVPGGSYQYWENESRTQRRTVIYHLSPDIAATHGRLELMDGILTRVCQQINYYCGFEAVRNGGVFDHPKHELGAGNPKDFKHNMIHMALGHELARAGGPGTVGYTTWDIDNDTIFGIETWLHFDYPDYEFPQLLMHEVMHGRWMLTHSNHHHVAVMRVNYARSDKLEDKIALARSRACLQVTDVLGMAKKVLIEDFSGKVWYSENQDLIHCMILYPTGETDPLKQQFISARTIKYTVTPELAAVAPELEVGDSYQVFKDIQEWPDYSVDANGMVIGA